MTPDASSDSEKATCFGNLPPEVRNTIYRHLFSLQDARVERCYRFGEDHDAEQYEAYVFPVAILRTSRLVHQEAHAVLYSGNLLVLLVLDTNFFSAGKLFTLAKDTPFNIFDRKALMPPAAVEIKLEIEYPDTYDKRIMFAAADIDLICHALHQLRWCACNFYGGLQFTVLKVPQHGWTSEQLSESIWKPLRSCSSNEWDCVMDLTGVFETRAEGSATEGFYDTETDGEWDTGEDEDVDADADTGAD